MMVPFFRCALGKWAERKWLLASSTSWDRDLALDDDVRPNQAVLEEERSPFGLVPDIHILIGEGCHLRKREDLRLRRVSLTTLPQHRCRLNVAVLLVFSYTHIMGSRGIIAK